MIQEYENQINNILQSEASLESKEQAVINMIEAIPSRSIQKFFMEEFKKYEWPTNDNDKFPSFVAPPSDVIIVESMVDGKKHKSIEVASYYGLLSYVKHALWERNLPKELSSLIEQALDTRNSCEADYSVKNDWHFRDFKYKVNVVDDQNVSVEIIENRKDLHTNVTETYTDHYDMMYKDCHYILENSLSLDKNDPKQWCSRHVSIDGKEVFVEWVYEGNNGKAVLEPYTDQDIEVIKRIGIADTNSSIFNRALNEDLGYNCKYRDDSYFTFGFDKKNGALRWDSLVEINKECAGLEVNGDKTTLKCYDIGKSTNDEISYKGFINENKDDKSVRKFADIVERLDTLKSEKASTK